MVNTSTQIEKYLDIGINFIIMEGQTTQLADARPKLDCPLRVALPVNAPERNATSTKDQFICKNAFSPNAISVSKKHHISLCQDYSELKFLDTKDKAPKIPTLTPVNMDHDALVKTAIRDFSVLALSSKRAGNKDVEATAYASLGVIHDNQQHYLEAIESYKSYLSICEEIKDTIGCAAAYNCIGVNYMLMANPPSDAGCLHGIKLTPETTSLLEKAVNYHTKHLEIGPDAGGRFVANTNLGLCLGMLDNINQSAKYHQDGLRVAIKMQTLYGQSIAVGNLGMLALVKQDFTTARTCFDQHLQLVQAVIDPEAEIEAWKLLSSLSTAQEDHVEALESLDQARRIAEREGLYNELRRINCLIGVSKGTLEFATFTESNASFMNDMTTGI